MELYIAVGILEVMDQSLYRWGHGMEHELGVMEWNRGLQGHGMEQGGYGMEWHSKHSLLLCKLPLAIHGTWIVFLGLQCTCTENNTNVLLHSQLP